MCAHLFEISFIILLKPQGFSTHGLLIKQRLSLVNTVTVMKSAFIRINKTCKLRKKYLNAPRLKFYFFI